MRKFLLLVVLFSGTFLLLCGYDVVLLSDTHYDSPELRAGQNKKEISKRNGVSRNLKAWKNNMPGYLEEYRARASKADFVIHCGDISHGNFGGADDTSMTISMQKGIAAFAEGIPGKFYCVKGNHENGCLNPETSSGKVIAEHLNGIGITPEKLNFALMHQGDLYIFFDSTAPDVEFVRRTLEANPASRYTFFVTHIPVLPCSTSTSTSGWVVLNRKNQRVELRELISMLAARNAVIICGHIHQTTLIRALYPEGSLTQISVYSLPVFNGKSQVEKIEPGEFMHRHSPDARYPVAPHLLELFDGHYLNFFKYTPHCGLHVLQITHDRVVMRQYDIKGKLVHVVNVK